MSHAKKVAPVLLTVALLVMAPLAPYAPIGSSYGASNDTVTIDDFEDGDTFVDVPGWSGWEDGDGVFSIESSNVIEGSYSGNLSVPASNNGAGVSIERASNSTTVEEVNTTVQIDTDSGYGGDAVQVRLTEASDGDGIARVQFDLDGGDVHTGSTHTYFSQWSTGSEYTVSFSNFDFANGNVDVKVSNSTASDTTTLSFDASSVDGFGLLSVAALKDNTNQRVNTYVDDVTVTDPESAGNPITGQVTTQDDRPVDNATVQVLTLNETNLTEQYPNPTELQRQAENLRENASNAWPGRLTNDETLLSDDRFEFVPSDANGASVSPSDLSEPYVAMHEADSWTTNWGTFNLDNPPLFHIEDAPAEVVLSVWNPGEEDLIENTVDGQLHGRTQEQGVTITQVGPRNDTLNSWTTEPTAQVGTALKTHFGSEVTLNEGLYWVQPEGGGHGYYVAVGNPAADFAASLRNEADQLSSHAQWIQDKIANNELDTEAVTTNSTGHFTVDGTGVHTATLQAHKGPADELIQHFSDVDSASDLGNVTTQDLRTFFNATNYNGSFYVPSAPQTARPGDDVTLRVTETMAPTAANQMDVQEAWDWLQDFLKDHTYTEALNELNQRINSLDEGELRDAYREMYEMVEQNAGVEERAGDILDGNSNVTSSLEDLYGDVTDNSTDLSNADLADLRSAIQDMEQALQEQQSTVPSEGDGTEIVNETLTASRVFQTDLTADGVMASVVFANGTSTTLTPDSEYMTVSSGGVTDGLGSIPGLSDSTTVTIEDYPVGDSPAVSVRWQAVSSDGTSAATDSAQNPAFGGTIPSLAAIDVSSLAPGPTEPVTVDVHPAETAPFGQVEDLAVTGPNGNALSTRATGDGTWEFTTAGAGTHDVEVTFSDTGGQNFTAAFPMLAESTDRSMDPGIRIRESYLGTYALTGDGLDGGSVDRASDGSSVAIAGEVDADNVPGTVHVYTHGLSLGNDATVDIAMLRAENERQLGQTVRVQGHFPSVGDNGLVWRRADGEAQALTTGDGALGYINASPSQTRIHTVTDDTGAVTVRTISDPSWYEQAEHRVDRLLQNVPDVPFIGN